MFAIVGLAKANLELWKKMKQMCFVRLAWNGNDDLAGPATHAKLVLLALAGGDYQQPSLAMFRATEPRATTSPWAWFYLLEAVPYLHSFDLGSQMDHPFPK